MTDPRFSVAFHIGAHKTATSHLQRSISMQASGLAALGVHWFGPDHLRKPRQSVRDLLGLTEGTSACDQITALFQTSDRIVFSEENYIGVPNVAPRRPVTRRYPDAARRISAVAQAVGRDVDVCLAIRRPTAFLNGTYCQQLMGGIVTPLAHFQRMNPLESVDWTDLVARLRAAPGVGQLVVWCYEDHATHFAAICTALLGPAAAGLVAPIDRHIHRSLSAAAVAEVLHRHSIAEHDDLGATARILLPVEDGYPPFDGFTAAEHAAGDAAYRAQIAAIGAMRGVRLLDPLWARASMRA